MSILHTSLQNKYYTNIPFPMEREKILEAMEAFFKFLELPEHIKSHIDFSIAPKHRRGDIGFKHRDGEDLYDDHKDFFHYHPEILKKHQDFLKENPILEEFINKAQPIWEIASDTVSNILTSLDKNYPGTHDKIFKTKEGEHVHILLRFLKYEWSQSGKYLAKHHFDAGSFTLAISESCPGLRIGSGPENLTPVEHKDGHAIFMCASNLDKVIHSHQLKPAWHDVVQIDETKIGKPCARWALVAFVEALDMEALSREETHKFYKG